MTRPRSLRAVAKCVASAVLLIEGCASSPPLHFYTLSEISPAARLTVPADTAAVQLDQVTIPAELDRAQLVRRIDPTQLMILESDHWAAPLDVMIRRVLSDDLTARLPTGYVVDPNEPSTAAHQQSLSVDIRELYADSNCAVTLRATWSLKHSPSQSQLSNFEVRVPPDSDCSAPGSLPAGISRALAQLSDRIAAQIAQPYSSASTAS